eukprot:623625-Pelagomonas_calceolata.AAC.2
MFTPPGLLSSAQVCFLVLWITSFTLQCLFPDGSIPVYYSPCLAVSRFDRRPSLLLNSNGGLGGCLWAAYRRARRKPGMMADNPPDPH